MTSKEKERLGEFASVVEGRVMDKRHLALLSRIFRNEMGRLMESHGCTIDKKSFIIKNDAEVAGSQYKMEFVPFAREEQPTTIASYSFRMTNAYDEWKRNKASLVKTLESHNQFARYESGANDADGCTFYQFARSIKEFCMLNNLYDVDADKNAGLTMGKQEVNVEAGIPRYSAPEYEPYDGDEYLM